MPTQTSASIPATQNESSLTGLTSQLAGDLARARNKNQLLQILKLQLGKCFPFTHCGLALLNEDEDSFTICLSPTDFHSGADLAYQQYMRGSHNIHDGITDKHLSSGGTIVLDLQELLARGNAPSYFTLTYQYGCRYYIGVPVGHVEDRAGLLHFWTDSIYPPEPAVLHLIRQVSCLVTLALSTIKAYEELREKENERDLLLRIGDAIAKARNKTEFAGAINETLRGLSLIKRYIIKAMDPATGAIAFYIFDETEPFAKDPDFRLITAPGSKFMDELTEQVFRSEDPVYIQVEDCLKSDPCPPYLHYWQQIGLTKMLGSALRTADSMVGILWVEPDQLNMELFKSICAQISSGLSTIIAHEAIQKQEREKSLLLSFSNEITAVTDKDQLRDILRNQLKNKFCLRNYAISLEADGDRDWHCFLYDMEAMPASAENPSWTVGHEGRPVSCLAPMLQGSDQPQTLDIASLLRKGLIAWPNSAFWEATRLDTILGVRLKVSDQVIGYLWLEPGQVEDDFLTGISSQIAVAISNFTGLENLQKREAEKSLLLSFSRDIATVADIGALAAAIKRHLHGLLPGMVYMISLVSEDRKTHRFALYDESADFAREPAFKQILETVLPMEGNIGGIVLASAEPVVFDIDELVADGTLSVSASFWQTQGLKKLIGIPLRTSNGDLGALWTDPTQTDLRMLINASAQIATALANIQANKQITQQLIAINNYKQRLEEENKYLHTEIVRSSGHLEILGTGKEMEKVYALLSQVAFANSTVLVMGETGTGKELVARAIHNSSPRKDRLMVKVNCAALPASLIESELFGHERGSFTGAHDRRLGKFELAHQGTLFLDEIGEMPLELQVKLLRAIQEKEIERIGGKSTIKVDVRLIAATNRDLLSEVKAGRFRSDLYYRLNVFPILLPPLRERREDIPVLATHFVDRFARNVGKSIEGVSAACMSQLVNYHWPGNVRELEHLIERSVLLAPGPVIQDFNLPVADQAGPLIPAQEPICRKTLEENERDYILEVLNQCKGKIYGAKGAALLLGVPATTLNSKLRKLGIVKNDTEFYSKGDLG